MLIVDHIASASIAIIPIGAMAIPITLYLITKLVRPKLDSFGNLGGNFDLHDLQMLRSRGGSGFLCLSNEDPASITEVRIGYRVRNKGKRSRNWGLGTDDYRTNLNLIRKVLDFVQDWWIHLLAYQ